MELFRFRNVRPVQPQPSDGLVVPASLGYDPPAPRDLTQVRQAAEQFLASGSMIDPATEQTWLTAFSAALALRSDLVSPAGCEKLLPQNWESQVGSQSWTDLGTQLDASLTTAVVKSQPPVLVEGLCRLLLVHDFLTTLASEAALPAADRTIRTAQDVQNAVAWRHVVLPAAYFPQVPRPLLARQPGMTDLYVIRDEWNRYEAGELAAVVNVLPGETLENKIRHSQETDTLTSTTTQTTTSQQTEQDQTTSTSLSESSSKDASINIGVQGQVQTSGQYGPTSVSTSLGAQLQVSQTTADSRASTSATQVVQRAVKSVSQTVTTVQSQRTVTKDSSYDDHKLENTGSTVTVGLYRWLEEIHRVELVRYPNRFVLEFEIPEPGAWLRWASANAPTTGWDNPDPGPFRRSGATSDLSPADITGDDWTTDPPGRGNWVQLAQQWRVQGLSAAPPPELTLSVQLDVDPGSQQGNSKGSAAMAMDTSLTVPAGYQATTWTWEFVAWKKADTSNPEASVTVTVGGGPQSQMMVTGPSPNAEVDQLLGAPPNAHGLVGPVHAGGIPISVYAFEDLQGFSAVINVTCTRTGEAFAQWQQDTFDQVASAYQALLTAHRQERDARNQQVSGQAELTGPPELNQARAVGELRRLVIQDLMGATFTGEPAVTADAATGEPSVDLAQAYQRGPLIQFYEQAFEWENLVYICYPYYWGRKTEFPDGTGTQIWVTDVTSASADPAYDQFLNAGSARVVVPARPGFEDLVAFYLFTGEIWGGTRPPAPDDPDYLSVAQEIQALERGATDGKPVGSSWEISLPTTLLWAGTDPATLPANGAATIPPPAAAQAGGTS